MLSAQQLVDELYTLICNGSDKIKVFLPSINLVPYADGAGVKPISLPSPEGDKETKSSEVVRGFYEKYGFLPLWSSQASRRVVSGVLSNSTNAHTKCAPYRGKVNGVPIDWKLGADMVFGAINNVQSGKTAASSKLKDAASALTSRPDWSVQTIYDEIRFSVEDGRIPFDPETGLTFIHNLSHRNADLLVSESTWHGVGAGADNGRQFLRSSLGMKMLRSRGGNQTYVFNISPMSVLNGYFCMSQSPGCKSQHLYGVTIDAEGGTLRERSAAKGQTVTSEMPKGLVYNKNRVVDPSFRSAFSYEQAVESRTGSKNSDGEDGEDEKGGKKKKKRSTAAEIGNSAMPPQSSLPSLHNATITAALSYNWPYLNSIVMESADRNVDPTTSVRLAKYDYDATNAVRTFFAIAGLWGLACALRKAESIRSGCQLGLAGDADTVVRFVNRKDGSVVLEVDLREFDTLLEADELACKKVEHLVVDAVLVPSIISIHLLFCNRKEVDSDLVKAVSELSKAYVGGDSNPDDATAPVEKPAKKKHGKSAKNGNGAVHTTAHETTAQ